jgi:hypothetical protein
MADDMTISVPIRLKGDVNVRSEKSDLARKDASDRATNSILKDLGFIAGAVGIMAVIWKGLEPVLKPVFQLLGFILTLLFMPLIPILKPMVLMLSDLATTLTPVMQKITERIDNMLGEGANIGDVFREMFTMIGAEVLPIFVDFFQRAMTPLVEGFAQFMSVLIPFLIPVLVEGFVVFINELAKVTPLIADAIATLVLGVMRATTDVFRTDLVTALGILVGVLATAILIIKGVTIGWAIALGVLLGVIIYMAIKGWVDIFQTLGELLKNTGNWFNTQLNNLFGSIISVITSILNRIKSISIPSPSQLFGRADRVQDFILHPNGRLIKTASDDFLVGTKSPEKMMGGKEITININNPVVREERDLQKITEMVSLNLQRNLQRRY